VTCPSEAADTAVRGGSAPRPAKRLKDVVTAGWFTRFRRATATPYNLVLEAKP
jgi:hypothetical protein